MGTRNITAVFLDGSYKIAQYGQWDGYPSGAGATILKFLQAPDFNRGTFEEKLRASRFLTDQEINDIWTQCGANPNSDSVSFEITDKVKACCSQLSRDTGADILHLVYRSPEGIGLSNQLPFAADSLFCEWAYVIDLDKGVLEVFRGFNEQPLTETDRFFNLQTVPSEYYPVKLVGSWPLSALPTEKELVDQCDPSEEEQPA